MLCFRESGASLCSKFLKSFRRYPTTIRPRVYWRQIHQINEAIKSCWLRVIESTAKIFAINIHLVSLRINLNFDSLLTHKRCIHAWGCLNIDWKWQHPQLILHGFRVISVNAWIHSLNGWKSAAFPYRIKKNMNFVPICVAPLIREVLMSKQWMMLSADCWRQSHVYKLQNIPIKIFGE